LPEGFFDDPDLDAKARGISRTDNLEAEYEEFKRAMQTEEFKSDLIIEKDDVMRDVDRDIVEVDELITRWTKIEQLHQQREALKESNKAKREEKQKSIQKMDEGDASSDDSDVDLDSVMGLALRAKNIC
jgi:zinc finger protein 830